jgi:hypothetical protein
LTFDQLASASKAVHVGGKPAVMLEVKAVGQVRVDGEPCDGELDRRDALEFSYSPRAI